MESRSGRCERPCQATIGRAKIVVFVFLSAGAVCAAGLTRLSLSDAGNINCEPIRHSTWEYGNGRRRAFEGGVKVWALVYLLYGRQRLLLSSFDVPSLAFRKRLGPEFGSGPYSPLEHSVLWRDNPDYNSCQPKTIQEEISQGFSGKRAHYSGGNMCDEF